MVGAKVFYAESLDKLIPNMNTAKPTIMTAVPRFYQTLYTKININFEKQKGFKKFLIFQTINLGKKKYFIKRNSTSLKKFLILFAKYW